MVQAVEGLLGAAEEVMALEVAVDITSLRHFQIRMTLEINILDLLIATRGDMEMIIENLIVR